MGVESIALDPSDPDRLYLSCGTYTSPGTPDGAILRSADRGRTFQRANVPFKMGGNENGRGNGERLAVDPNDGRVLFLGTRHAGLWRSGDRGATWSRVESFPDVHEVLPPKPPDEPPWVQRGGSGVVFVVFDPRSGKPGAPSSTLYAGVSLMGRENLFRSRDGGRTWQPVPGHPTAYRPNHAVLASDGTLYVSYGTNPGPWRMERRRSLEARHRHGRLDGHHAGEAAGRQALRLRGGGRGRARPAEADREHVRPPGRARRGRDLPQHRRGEDLEAGVRRADARPTTSRWRRTSR